MARCGNCGLFYNYSEPKGQNEGFCVYYQILLSQDDVWAQRDCDDFTLKAPTSSAFDHFNIKIRRDDLGDAYREARRSKTIALVSLGLSIANFLSRML